MKYDLFSLQRLHSPLDLNVAKYQLLTLWVSTSKSQTIGTGSSLWIVNVMIEIEYTIQMTFLGIRRGPYEGLTIPPRLVQYTEAVCSLTLSSLEHSLSLQSVHTGTDDPLLIAAQVTAPL